MTLLFKGGLHDWFFILGDLGLVPYAHPIADVVRASGWIGMIGAWGFLMWRWIQDGRRKNDNQKSKTQNGKLGHGLTQMGRINSD